MTSANRIDERLLVEVRVGYWGDYPRNVLQPARTPRIVGLTRTVTPAPLRTTYMGSRAIQSAAPTGGFHLADSRTERGVLESAEWKPASRPTRQSTRHDR